MAAMPSSLRRSRKGMSTIIAEALMVVIVIVMSTILIVWVVPVFSTNTTHDNAGAAYSEKFETVQGQFATYVQSTPEPVRNSPSPPTPYTTCTSPSPITSPTSANIFVPANGVCIITAASVGSVFVSQYASLTVTGATINGDLNGNYSSSISLTNTRVTGFSGFYNVQAVSISGGSFNTSGGGAAMYGGGRGSFTMTGATVNGLVENEVGHQTFFVGDRISGELEVESADQGQIINSTVSVLNLDQNGIIVISGNNVNGNVLYGQNGWCATGNNLVSGSISGTCVGNTEVDVMNTGSIPVNLIAIYLSNRPIASGLSWQLASGNQVQCGTIQSQACTQLPIIIPVGDMARITMGWTPPPGDIPLPWNYVYFVFVSSHSNFVDGYLYFSIGLGLSMQSRLENRVCPPCY
jgi:hypothetical protein